MKRFARHIPIIFALGLGACTSAPIHYYTLLAPPTPSAAANEAPVPFLIDVLPVGIPAQHDQAQLLVRQGDTGVAILDGERWASPLVDELRSALSASLTERLQTRDIAGFSQPAGKPVLRIKLQIHRFDAWPGQQARIDADWGLSFAGEATNARQICGGRFEEAAPGGYPELVRAQQRMIATLSARIAEDARQWQRSRSVRCSPGTSP